LAIPAGPADRGALADRGAQEGPDRVSLAGRVDRADLENPAGRVALAARADTNRADPADTSRADRAAPVDTSRAAQAAPADMGRVALANRAGRVDRAGPENLAGTILVVQAGRAALGDPRDRAPAHPRDRARAHPRDRARAALTPVHPRRRLPDPDPTRAHPHRMRAHRHLTQAHPHRTRAHPHLTRARLRDPTHPGVATHPPVPAHPTEVIRLAAVIRLAEATHPGEATHEPDIEGATPHYHEFS
jgi:hypothetical protein